MNQNDENAINSSKNSDLEVVETDFEKSIREPLEDLGNPAWVFLTKNHLFMRLDT